MSWFDILAERGTFAPDQNPDPMEKDNGYAIPYWTALDYLKSLAKKIAAGEELDKIDKLLNIIRAVSESPKDNYHTWYSFIDILADLPNERISEDILKYLPIWFSSRFDVSLQSSELCEKLLPKFVHQPTGEDLIKAKTILNFMFSLTSVVGADKLNKPAKSFVSPINHYYLVSSMIKVDTLKQIANWLGEFTGDLLAERLHILLRDNAIVAELVGNYVVFLIPDVTNLQLSIRTADDVEVIAENIIFENYPGHTTEEIVVFVNDQVRQAGLQLPDEQAEFYRRLRFGLDNDFSSMLGMMHIADLDDEIRTGSETLGVFALAFRQLLQHFVSQHPAQAKAYLQKLAKTQSYQLPFYKRVLFYIIAGHWQLLRDIFWQLLANKDESGYFSHYPYQPELYFLLNKVQYELTTEEENKLEEILAKGSKKDDNPETIVAWKLRWLDALKNNRHFKPAYDEAIGKTSGRKIDYAEEGKIKVRVGHVSPFTVEEILDMPFDQLYEEILSFEGDGFWDGPSASGFADNFGKAVELQPGSFVNYLPQALDLPLLYTDKLYLALSQAWRAGRYFEWEPVLDFSKVYLLTIGEKRVTTLDTNPKWTIGYIAYLLSDGLKKDDEGLPLRLMPKIKELLIMMGSELPEIQKADIITDYPTYTYNSLAGKILRFALDFSLRSKRHSNNNWDQSAKNIFLTATQRQLVDPFAMVGMYLDQFLWLDQNWTDELLADLLVMPEELWLAFAGGLAFNNPNANTERYRLLIPHYQRALQVPEALKESYHHGLIRQLALYFVWDMTPTYESSLLYQLIQCGLIEPVKELIQFFWQQENAFKRWSNEDQEKVRSKVLLLWKEIASKFADNQSIMASLLHFVAFVNDLNAETTSLVLKSLPFTQDMMGRKDLLEELIRLNTGINRAVFIGEILEKMNLNDYLMEDERQMLSQLIRLLYESQQKPLADKICVGLSLNGYDFLQEIYYRHQ